MGQLDPVSHLGNAQFLDLQHVHWGAFEHGNEFNLLFLLGLAHFLNRVLLVPTRVE